MAVDARRFDELSQALVRGGYRLTPQREAVLRVLAESEQHPSVDQIYELARERCRSTSRATVYNTVSVLKQLGEVLELEFGGAGNRYDGRMPHAHAHLVCTACGRIEDFERGEVQAALAAAAAASGYDVTAHRLDFYGACPTCQAAQRTRA